MSVKLLSEAEGLCALPNFLPPGWRKVKDSNDGAAYRGPKGLTVILSVAKELDGFLWLHVSVAHRDRLPTYEELKLAKALFIGREKQAIQVFAPESKHVNLHPNCLHLWHCLNGQPLPDFTRGGKSL